MATGSGYGTPGSTLILDKVKLYLQPLMEPVITEDELQQILVLGKRKDINGIYPDEENYIETIDHNWCIAEGFKIKAAKASGSYQFKNESLELHREQIITNCLKMVSEYSKKTITSVPIKIDVMKHPITNDMWSRR